MKKLLVISILILALLSSSHVLAADRGVTDNSIKIGMVGDYTGPIASLGQQVVYTLRMYFQSINEAGGIHGRKLILVTESDNYQPAQTVAGVKKLISRDKVFAFTCSLGSVVLPVIPIVEKDKTPLVGPLSSNKELYFPPKRYIFPLLFSHYNNSRLLVKYIVEHKKIKSPRIFAIYQDDNFGKEAMDGLDFQMKKYNLKLVGKTGYKRGTVDFSSHVAKAKNSKADFVFLGTVYPTAAQILKEAKRMDWKPMFIANQASLDPKLIEIAGDAAEGRILIPNYNLPNEPNPSESMQEFVNMLKKYHPDKEPSNFPMLTYSVAKIIGEGLRRAGRDLTREKFVDALENMKDFPLPLGPPLSYGPISDGFKSRVGMTKQKIWGVQNGEFKLVSGWIEVD